MLARNLGQHFPIYMHRNLQRALFQVIGHVKTVFIFFFGWLLFDIPMTFNNIFGGAVLPRGYLLLLARVRDREGGGGASASITGIVRALRRYFVILHRCTLSFNKSPLRDSPS